MSRSKLKTNLLELCSDLADAVVSKIAIYNKEESSYIDRDQDDTVWIYYDKYQDLFNEYYDEFYNLLTEKGFEHENG